MTNWKNKYIITLQIEKSNNQRGNKMAWTDEKRAAVIEAYKAALETMDTDEQRAAESMEIVKEIAEEFEESPNGTRMILTKAGVYVKKTPTAKTATTSSSGGAKRVNKAEAIQTLTNQISAIDPDLVDSEILEKLTGKAANYFSEILNVATAE